MADMKWLSTEQISIGSVWVAADGGSYGHIIVGHNVAIGDVYVAPWRGTTRTLHKSRQFRLDYFKLQYRYSLDWTPPPMDVISRLGRLANE